MAFDGDMPAPQLPSVVLGQVTDNDDPEGLGRVKLMVPGLVEPESDWAWPMNGGARNFGLFMVPPVGAQVMVFWERGDIEGTVFYQPGPWAGAAPDAEEDSDQSEVPDEARASEKPQEVVVLSTPRFLITLDESGGVMSMRSRNSQARVEIDDKTGSISILAKSTVSIEGSYVRIDGMKVVIKDRPVLVTPKQI